METYYQYAMDLYASLLRSSWAWFAGLTREEWLIVLAGVSAAGFICMRGFGSRSEY